jgi:Ser/Thr protein kinase RdoA (MazF antagonist)
MLEKTILNDSIIKEILKNNYAIDVQKIEKLELGSSNLFKITAVQGLYILKEYESKYNEKDIEREAKVTNYLRSCGIPTSEFIETIDRSFYYKIENKYISIQKYIEGITPKPNSANYKQLMISAEYLGRIISLLKDKTIYNTISTRNIMTQDVFDDAILNYNKIIKQYKNVKDKHFANEVIEELEAKQSMLNIIRHNDYVLNNVTKVTVSNTHGDYTMMQCLYSESGELIAILDFTSVGCNPVVWEVIRSYSYDDAECIDGHFKVDNFIDYVRHFCQFFPLTKTDLQIFVLFLAIANNKSGLTAFSKY